MKKPYLVLMAAALFLTSCNQTQQQSENEYLDEQMKTTSIEFHAPALLAVDSLGISADFSPQLMVKAIRMESRR